MQYSIDTKKQHRYINAIFDSGTLSILKNSRAFVAGGAISSLFTNRKVNDWDVFFPKAQDNEVESSFLKYGWKRNFATSLAHTFEKDMQAVPFNEDSAKESYGATIIKNTEKIQLVNIFFGTPSAVFQTFDFYCCMGAYDFFTEEFIFDPRFITDNLNRSLHYNYEGSISPFKSIIRVEKYKEYGYSISMCEMIKILMGINKIKIETIGDLVKQLRTFPNGGYKNVITQEMIRKNLGNINFNTPEGILAYKEFMKKPFDADLFVQILSDLHDYTIKPAKDTLIKDTLEDYLLK